MNQPIQPGEGILHHGEGVDLMSANIQLADMEVSLGMLTVNALAAADRIIVPVQSEYLPVKDLEQLLQTVGKVRRQINPKLQIDGILLTMVDSRTNIPIRYSANYREISAWGLQEYGLKVASRHITQVKRKHGIITQGGQNGPLPEGVEPAEVPPGIEVVIKAALRHFYML